MNKYAYNFTEKNKSKVLKGGVLDFDKLLKGYYDDIENIDNEIKNSKSKLDSTKDWTIKSCAYSYLDVPSSWKNKTEYPTRLMKLINQDSSFFNYLTKFSKSDNNSQKNPLDSNDVDNKLSKEDTRSSFMEQTHPRGRQTKTGSSHFKSDFFDAKNHQNLDDSFQKTASRFSPNPSNALLRKMTISTSRNAKAYSGKEIREILDNYNERYKTKKIPKENVENTTASAQDKKIILPSLIKKSDTGNIYSMIDNLNSTQKSQLFKSTIYNSIVPVKLNRIGSESKGDIQDKNLKNNHKSKTEYGPFLNFNYEEFNKKIEITNPEVKKLLEDLNYYGPHFSHCPSCRNKNLEFYETLEPSQCIKILQFIKKSKKKNKK